MTKENELYKKELEVYIESNQLSLQENGLLIEHYNALKIICAKKVKLAEEQNNLTLNQINQAKESIKKLK